MLCYLDIAKTWEILFVLSEELSEYSENEGYIIVFFFYFIKKKEKETKVKKKKKISIPVADSCWNIIVLNW